MMEVDMNSPAGKHTELSARKVDKDKMEATIKNACARYDRGIGSDIKRRLPMRPQESRPEAMGKFSRFNPALIARNLLAAFIDARIKAYGALRQSDLRAALRSERENN